MAQLTCNYGSQCLPHKPQSEIGKIDMQMTQSVEQETARQGSGIHYS